MVKETRKVSIRQRTHEGIDNMMDKAESVGERGKEEMVHLRERAMKVRKNVDNYIQKNPERSVLIAVGIGLAVGVILVATMRGRNHKDRN